MGNFESHSDYQQGLDMTKLAIDEAYVMFSSTVANDSWVYSLTPECVKCDPKLEIYKPITSEDVDAHTTIVSTEYPLKLYASLYEDGTNLAQCSQDASFGEFGVYSCSIFNNNSSDTNTYTCQCTELVAAADMYWPILCAFAFYFGLGALWLLSLFGYRKVKKSAKIWPWRNNSLELEEDNKNLPALPFGNQNQPVDEQVAKLKTRIKSIDTFRGVCITLMIFVNYGGGGYYFFEHSPWNGLTVADLLFPWFMWLMGVCLPISTRSLLRRKRRKSLCFVKILKRSLWLFVLGLGISNIDNLDVNYLRIFGVLQRFAITYFILGSLHMAFVRTGRPFTDKPSIFRDLIDIAQEWFVIILIVMLHLLLTFFLPVPGCPTGYLGPGGRHDHGNEYNCTGGATGYIDRQVLGDNHCYQNPTPKPIYGTVVPFDPEGIFATLQACFQVMLGLQAGMILQVHKSWKHRVVRWLIWCVITGAIGAVLCKASLEDGWIPVNKNLWSISFVLVTSSFAFFLLACFYVIVDVLKWWNGAPFFYPGMNSILLYVGHEITTNIFPFQWDDSLHESHVHTHGYQLVLDLWVPTLWVVIAMWLYSIKFFVAL